MINALGIFRECIKMCSTLTLQLLWYLNLRAMRDSNNYFLDLHTLAVFTDSIDVSVTYPKLVTQSSQSKFGTFSLLPFFYF